MNSITSQESLSLYRKLLLARQAEEKIRQEYPKDEMKTPVHLGIGGEAIPVGICHCLPEHSKSFGTYRNHALYLAITDDTDGFFAELYGKASGPAKGKAGSMHLASPEHGLMATSAVVGTTIPLAVGAALANAYNSSPDLVTVFFGDGALEEGVFWESLNFACLHKLRILFVCEDNGLAIHAPSHERRAFRSISGIAQNFDCHIAAGDGSDMAEVIALTRSVLNGMSQDPKPGFLHLTYFRFLEHVGIGEDFDSNYRRRPSPEECQRLDPLIKFERLMLQNGCRPEELAAIKTAVEDRLNSSVTAARKAPFPGVSELYTDVQA
jgi:TPP-dependent pyruvate/acetoin dehydrogenase alpha subunit